MNNDERVSTGMPYLDKIINDLRIGDNVVIRVGVIEEYIKFVEPFVQSSLDGGRRVVYMRFARHRPIINKDDNVRVYHIDADKGFDSFTTEVHKIIAAEGEEVFYVFDCLSDLLHSWSTDLMIGNFFAVTCPYLYELNTVAYFALYRDSNSFDTIAVIRDTTQVLLDTFEVGEERYVYPLKVWNRYSSTMYLPHRFSGNELIPVADSGEAAKLFADLARIRSTHPVGSLDYWDRLFLKARTLIDNCDEAGCHKKPSPEDEELLELLCKAVITRDEKMLPLVRQNFDLEDLLFVKSRLIGSGLIGGKAVGMLLARKVLCHDGERNWNQYMEHHDSFYIGSDVYYTYLVKNGLWKMRMAQKRPENYYSAASELKQKLLQGTFPDNIKAHFLRMLEYFGQAPVIVRSSSLLEDAFGNAFAGKYESVFCSNQGSLEERYERFEDAVRRVFSSSMDESALSYRLKRGLDQHDEQMALLVQRVSGSHRKDYFFPDVAGVGFSYNTYVWEKRMDPSAGMLRMVAGLGTRAVNRVEGDYARIVPLDNPLLKPYAGSEDYKRFSQRKVDVLNLRENSLQSVPVEKLLAEGLDLKLPKIGERDYLAEERLRELGRDNRQVWILSFDGLAVNTQFYGCMQKMMKTLEKAYRYPVDIEFTARFKDNGDFRINLLQCRPLQVKGLKAKVELPANLNKEKVFFQSPGNFMGGNIYKPIQRIIYVDPLNYSRLTQRNKFEVARAVGRINKLIGNRSEFSAMLLGPGRWGSTTPSLGVPVKFSEISNMAVLSEVACLQSGFAPELSYGTHFFQDLVENDIFFVALFPENEGVVLRKQMFENYENIFPQLVPCNDSLQDVIKVYDVDRGIHVASDVINQKVVCFASGP